jgi:anti-anti-sigma factor
MRSGCLSQGFASGLVGDAVGSVVPVSGVPDGGCTLDIEISSDDEAVHVRLSGELELSTADLLLGSLAQLNLDGHRLVVLNLADLTFCDARGLEALLRVHRTLEQDGRRLSIREMAPLTQRLMAITNLDEHLNVT